MKEKVEKKINLEKREEENLTNEQREFLNNVYEIVNAYEDELNKMTVLDAYEFGVLYTKFNNKLQDFICMELYCEPCIKVFSFVLSNTEIPLREFSKNGNKKISYKAINKIADFYNISLYKVSMRSYKNSPIISKFDSLSDITFDKEKYAIKYLDEEIDRLEKLAFNQFVDARSFKRGKIRNFKFSTVLVNILNNKTYTMKLILNDDLEILKQTLDIIIYGFERTDLGSTFINNEIFSLLSKFVICAFQYINGNVKCGKLLDILKQYFLIAISYVGIPYLEEAEIKMLYKSFDLIIKKDKFENESNVVSCKEFLRNIQNYGPSKIDSSVPIYCSNVVKTEKICRI